MVQGVDPAPLPAGDTVEDWQAGFIEQTGQLEKANGATKDVDHIYRTCLDMHRDALKKSMKGRFLGIL